MDGLKPNRGSHRGRTNSRPVSHRPASTLSHPTQTGRHSGEKYWLVRSLGKVASRRKQKLWEKFKQTEFAKWPDKRLRNRIYVFAVLGLFVFSTAAAIIQPFLDDKFYGVTEAARGVLPEPSASLGTYLKYNDKDKKFTYNEGYTGSTGNQLSKTGQGEPRISTTLAKEPSKGVTVTDPLNKVDFTLKPKFKLNVGKQDRNQVFYPLTKTAGYLVYTNQIASIKEDIVLEKPGDDRMEFEYELDVANGLEARQEKNGSIGIYGASLPINGNVSTGSEKDAELLQKARENTKKDKLLFVIPAPVVVEAGKEQSSVISWFELKDGKNLKVISEGLKAANYPLSIDPSVYVQSAAQLMRGNNETNVEFDVATEQFKKGTTTGARIDEWTSTSDMNDAVWDQGTAAAGGYVYRAGGKTSRALPWIVSTTTTTQSTATSNAVVNMPAERPTGDLYILILGLNFTGTGPSSPCAPGDVPANCGWTPIKTLNNQMGAFWRYDTSGSYPSTYTFGLSTGQDYTATVLRIKGFNTSSPINTSGTVNNGTIPVSYPSVTPSQHGTLVVAAAAYTNAPAKTSGFSPGTDWADVTSIHSTGSADSATSGMMVSSLDVPPASGVATGSQSLAASGANSNYSAFTAAINGNSVATATSASVQWAHFNSTNGSIDSPAPGSNGASCSGWCTDSAYDLPTNTGSTSDGAGLVGTQLVAYNGYLYNIGGYDGTQMKSTVYISKLGANGEPSKWHPTDPDQPDWNYWHKDSGLSGGGVRAYHSAYASNGKMYVLGGDTDAPNNNTGATNTVFIADILPNGTLGSWSSGTSLPSNMHSMPVQAYNGYLYVIGGRNNGTMLTNASTGTVYYTKINTDGSLNSWNHAAADGSGVGFATPRASHGGLMSGIWGAYIYLAGGCSVVNASGNCTTISSDAQLASINADGTLDVWNTMKGLRNQRVGYSFIAWQDSLYRFGGCSRQDATSGDCYAAHKNVQYGNINQDGDASTVSVTTASGVGLCQGDDPYDCNLPTLGDNADQSAHMLSATAILNGYLYVIGGCAQFTCSSGDAVSGNVSYVGISSDGKLKRPPTCATETVGSWCVDAVNTVNGATGIAASGVAVFGGYIYIVGGLSGAGNVGNVWRNTTNSDGSLVGGWTAQTFANLAITTAVSYTFAYARANPSNATYPGNLYIFGGCGNSTQAGCTAYQTEVYKCNILATGALEQADANDCDTTGQLQIDSETAGGNQGLGIHAGTVYANYIYLIGGVSDNEVDRKSILYAKFDNSNNIIAVSGSAWVRSGVEMDNGRRRGTAFGYNGYLYAVGGFEATINAALDTIEFVKINVSDGSLISDNYDSVLGVYEFTKSSVTINQRWGLSLAVSNSFAYIIGGCNVGASPGGCSSFDPTVQTFQVYNNDSGAPAGYIKETDLFATDRIGTSAAVHNGYIYIAGGCINSTNCATGSDVTSSVQYATIDTTGNTGAWTTANSLPAARAWGQLEIAGGSLYYVGGQSGVSNTATTTVYYSTGFSSGNPSWGTATNGLPTAKTKLAATVWNNRIYVVAGNNTTPAATANVYVSPQLNSGGNITSAWSTTSTSLNAARSGAVAIAYANNLYVLGGDTGSAYLSDVQFAKIDSGTGDVTGGWTYSTNLPSPVSEADGFALNGYMYMLGGRSSTNDCQPRTLVAPISANTTIASGNNPTGIGEWYETNRKFDTGRFGNAAVYYQGKAYVLGGGCQGIVMQDDFDDISAPYYDATQWSYTTGMAANTNCQSTSTSKTFSTNDGSAANRAETKTVDVSSGGTIHFKLYIPVTDTGTCYRNEQTFSFLTAQPEHVVLEYCTGLCGSWTQIGGTYAFGGQDPLKTYAVTIPGTSTGNQAWTTSSKFRWRILNGEANDSFALEDVSIIANGSSQIAYTGTARVAYTTLLSQPQVASYSRLIDAGRDVFPTSWLMNGLDNSIGARWQFAYRSMNDSTVTDTDKACGGSVMSTFGQLTNFGNVTLGIPNKYTVKNGAGTDIKCSRYFFMNVTIDASQTYGYPDDISRGPTLDNLTLFFQSNPGQRLIHGKAFIEGSQQPLDTQCRQSNPLVSGDPSASGCLP